MLAPFSAWQLIYLFSLLFDGTFFKNLIHNSIWQEYFECHIPFVHMKLSIKRAHASHLFRLDSNVWINWQRQVHDFIRHSAFDGSKQNKQFYLFFNDPHCCWIEFGFLFGTFFLALIFFCLQFFFQIDNLINYGNHSPGESSLKIFMTVEHFFLRRLRSTRCNSLIFCWQKGEVSSLKSFEEMGLGMNILDFLQKKLCAYVIIFVLLLLMCNMGIQWIIWI